MNGHTEAASAYRESTSDGDGTSRFGQSCPCRHDVVHHDHRAAGEDGCPSRTHRERLVEVVAASLRAQLGLVADPADVSQRRDDPRRGTWPAAAGRTPHRGDGEITNEVRAATPPVACGGRNRDEQRWPGSLTDGQAAGDQGTRERKAQRSCEVVPAAVLPGDDEPRRHSSVGRRGPHSGTVRPGPERRVARPGGQEGEAGGAEHDVRQPAPGARHREGEAEKVTGAVGQRPRERGGRLCGGEEGWQRGHAVNGDGRRRATEGSERICGQVGELLTCGKKMSGTRRAPGDVERRASRPGISGIVGANVGGRG
jgi:hypothetical protein